MVRWSNEGRMDADQEHTLFSLLEWLDRRQRWEAIPEDARREVVAELARLMIRLVVREQNGDGSDHG